MNVQINYASFFSGLAYTAIWLEEPWKKEPSFVVCYLAVSLDFDMLTKSSFLANAKLTSHEHIGILVQDKYGY